MRKLFFIITLFFVGKAFAVTSVTRYGVDTCANNGDGTVNSPCAGSPGAAGPYNKIVDGYNDIVTDYPDFQASDVEVTLVMSGTSQDYTGTDGLTIAGTNRNATHRLIIKSADTDSATCGGWDTGKYRVAGLYRTFIITGDYVVLDGLQIQAGNTDDNGLTGVRVTGASHVVIKNNYIRNNPSTPSYGAGSLGVDLGTDGAGLVYVVNNVIVGFTDTSNSGVYAVSSVGYVYNNTLLDCKEGIHDAYSKIRAKNNLVQGATTGYSNNFHGDSTNNLSNDATAPGSNPHNSATVVFSSGACLDPSDTAALDHGADLHADADYPFAEDMDGDVRPDGSWDIGADEVAASAAAYYVPNKFNSGLNNFNGGIN